MEKRCSKCGEVKEIEEFYTKKVKWGSIGYYVTSWCKLCEKKCSSNWSKKNRARINEHQNRRRKQNRNKGRIYEAKARANPTPKFTEKMRKARSIWSKRHPEYSWIKKNPEKRKEIANKYNRNQIKTISDVYLKSTLSRFIPRHLISEQLVDLKREQVLLKRNLKKLKEVYNEPNHTNIDAVESKNAKNFQGELHSGTDFK